MSPIGPIQPGHFPRDYGSSSSNDQAQKYLTDMSANFNNLASTTDPTKQSTYLKNIQNDLNNLSKLNPQLVQRVGSNSPASYETDIQNSVDMIKDLMSAGEQGLIPTYASISCTNITDFSATLVS